MGNICSCLERNKITRYKLTCYGFKKIVIYDSYGNNNNSNNNHNSRQNCIS